MRWSKLDEGPHACNGEVIAPGAGGRGATGDGNADGYEDEGGHVRGADYRERTGADQIEDVNDEKYGGEQKAAGGTKLTGEAVSDAAGGEDKHNQEKRGEGGGGDDKRMAAVTLEYREEDCADADGGP